MKKKFSILIIMALGLLALVISIFNPSMNVYAADSTSVTTYTGSTTSKVRVYTIDSESDFITFTKLSSISNNDVFLLTKDLDYSSLSAEESIVTALSEFRGVFNGQNHSIAGLKIAESEEFPSVYSLIKNNKGIFNNVTFSDLSFTQGTPAKNETTKSFGSACLIYENNGSIDGITMDTCDFEATLMSESAVVRTNNGFIRNVITKKSTIRGLHLAGGIVGYNTASGTIEGCQVLGTKIYGTQYAGGIAAYSKGIINSCVVGRGESIDSTIRLEYGDYDYTNVNIIHDTIANKDNDINSANSIMNYAGGIVGLSTESTIFNCVYYTCEITLDYIQEYKNEGSILSKIGKTSSGLISGYSLNDTKVGLCRASGSVVIESNADGVSTYNVLPTSYLFGNVIGDNISASENFYYKGLRVCENSQITIDSDPYAMQLDSGMNIVGASDTLEMHRAVEDENLEYAYYKITDDLHGLSHTMALSSSKTLTFRFHTDQSDSNASKYTDLMNHSSGLLIISKSGDTPWNNFQAMTVTGLTKGEEDENFDTIYSGSASYSMCSTGNEYVWYFDALKNEYVLFGGLSSFQEYVDAEHVEDEYSKGYDVGFDMYSLFFTAMNPKGQIRSDFDFGLTNQFYYGKGNTAASLENVFHCPNGYELMYDEHTRAYVNGVQVETDELPESWFGVNIYENSSFVFYISGDYVNWEITNAGVTFDDDTTEIKDYYEDGDAITERYKIGSKYTLKSTDYILTGITWKCNGEAVSPAKTCKGKYNVELTFTTISSLESTSSIDVTSISNITKINSAETTTSFTFTDYYAASIDNMYVIKEKDSFYYLKDEQTFLLFNDCIVYGKTSDGKYIPVILYQGATPTPITDVISVSITYPDSTEMVYYIPSSFSSYTFPVIDSYKTKKLTVNTEGLTGVIESGVDIDLAARTIKLSAMESTGVSLSLTADASYSGYVIYYYSDSEAFKHREEDASAYKDFYYSTLEASATFKNPTEFMHPETKTFEGWYDENGTKQEVGTTLTADLYVYPKYSYTISIEIKSFKDAEGVSKTDILTEFNKLVSFACGKDAKYYLTATKGITGNYYYDEFFLVSYDETTTSIQIRLSSELLEKSVYLVAKRNEDLSADILSNRSEIVSIDLNEFANEETTLSIYKIEVSDVEGEFSGSGWYYEFFDGEETHSESVTISYTYNPVNYALTITNTNTSTTYVEDTDYTNNTDTKIISFTTLKSYAKLSFDTRIRTCDITVSYQIDGKTLFTKVYGADYGTQVSDIIGLIGTLVTNDETTYYFVMEYLQELAVVNSPELNITATVQAAQTVNVSILIDGVNPTDLEDNLVLSTNGTSYVKAEGITYTVSGNTLYYIPQLDGEGAVVFYKKNGAYLPLGSIANANLSSSYSGVMIQKSDNITIVDTLGYSQTDNKIYLINGQEITISLRIATGYKLAEAAVSGITYDIDAATVTISSTYDATAATMISIVSVAITHKVTYTFKLADGTLVDIQIGSGDDATYSSTTDVEYAYGATINQALYNAGVMLQGQTNLYMIVDTDGTVNAYLTMPNEDLYCNIILTTDFYTIDGSIKIDGTSVEFTDANLTTSPNADGSGIGFAYIGYLDGKMYVYLNESTAYLEVYTPSKDTLIHTGVALDSTKTIDVNIYSITFELATGINSVALESGASISTYNEKPVYYYCKEETVKFVFTCETDKGINIETYLLNNDSETFSSTRGSQKLTFTTNFSSPKAYTLNVSACGKNYDYNYTRYLVDEKGEIIRELTSGGGYHPYGDSIIFDDYEVNSTILLVGDSGDTWIYGLLVYATYDGEETKLTVMPNHEVEIVYKFVQVQANSFYFTVDSEDGAVLSPVKKEADGVEHWYMNGDSDSYFVMKDSSNEDLSFKLATAKQTSSARFVYVIACDSPGTLYLTIDGVNLSKVLDYTPTTSLTWNDVGDNEKANATYKVVFFSLNLTVTDDASNSCDVSGNGFYVSGSDATFAITAPSAGYTVNEEGIAEGTLKNLSTDGTKVTFTVVASTDTPLTYTLKKIQYTISYGYQTFEDEMNMLVDYEVSATTYTYGETIEYPYSKHDVWTYNGTTYIIANVNNGSNYYAPPTTMQDYNMTIRFYVVEATKLEGEILVNGTNALVYQDGNLRLKSGAYDTMLVGSQSATEYDGKFSISYMGVVGKDDSDNIYYSNYIKSFYITGGMNYDESGYTYKKLFAIGEAMPTEMYCSRYSGFSDDDNVKTIDDFHFYTAGETVSIKCYTNTEGYGISTTDENITITSNGVMIDGYEEFVCTYLMTNENHDLQLSKSPKKYNIIYYKDKTDYDSYKAGNSVTPYDTVSNTYTLAVVGSEKLGTIENNQRLDSWLNEDGTPFELTTMPANEVIVYGSWLQVGGISVTARFTNTALVSTDDLAVAISYNTKDEGFEAIVGDDDYSYNVDGTNHIYTFTYDTSKSPTIWIKYPGDSEYTYMGEAKGVTEVSYTYYYVDVQGTFDNSTVTGGGWYATGTSATINISVNEGYRMDVVSGDYSINNGVYTIPFVNQYTKVEFEEIHIIYKLRYFIGDASSPWKTEEHYFGDAITMAEYDAKDYIFTGWDKTLETMPAIDVIVKGKVSPIKRISVNLDLSKTPELTYENFYVSSSPVELKGQSQAKMLDGKITFEFVGEAYVWLNDPITGEMHYLGIQPTTTIESISLVKITTSYTSGNLTIKNLGYLLSGHSQTIKVVPNKGYEFRVTDPNVKRIGNMLTVEAITEDYVLPIEDYMIEYYVKYYVSNALYYTQKYYYGDAVTMVEYGADVEGSSNYDSEFEFEQWSISFDSKFEGKMPDYDINVYAQAKAAYVIKSYPVLSKLHAGEELSASIISGGQVMVGDKAIILDSTASYDTSVLQYFGSFEFENGAQKVTLADSMSKGFVVMLNVYSISPSGERVDYVPLVLSDVTLEVCNPKYQLPSEEDILAIDAIIPNKNVVVTDSTITFTLDTKYEYSTDGYIYYAGGTIFLENLNPETEYRVYYRYKADTQYCESDSNSIYFTTLTVENMDYNNSVEEGYNNLYDFYGKLDNADVKEQIVVMMTEFNAPFEERTMSAEEMQEFVAYVTEALETILEIEESRQKVEYINDERVQSFISDKEKEITDWVLSFYSEGSDKVDIRKVQEYKRYVVNVSNTCDSMVVKFNVELSKLKGDGKTKENMTALGLDDDLLDTSTYVVDKVDELFVYDHTNYSNVSLTEYSDVFVSNTVTLMGKISTSVHECDGTKFAKAINDSVVTLKGMTYMDYKFDRAAYDAAFYLAAEAAIIAHLQSVVLNQIEVQYKAVLATLLDPNKQVILEQVKANLIEKYSDYEAFREMYFEAIGDSGDILYEDVVQIFKEQIEKSMVIPAYNKLTNQEVIVVVCFASAIGVALLVSVIMVVLKKKKKGVLYAR